MTIGYYASSPTVVLPPQQPPHYVADFNALRRQSPPFGRKHPIPPSMNYLASSNNSVAGRKRTIHDVEPEDLPADCPSAIPVESKPKPEPIYGPGMTLIYPDDPGFHIAAESQTGTWAEEKEEEEEEREPSPSRPVALSRKSQRVNPSPLSPVAVLGRKQRQSEIIDENGHTINQLITELGIGWRNMMIDSPARRAYIRVIENHFPLTDATIMLESEALSAYLVRARTEGVVKYWLFHDTLSWCQLLSSTLPGAVQNLQAGAVPVIEGPRIIAQRNTPPNQPSTLDVEMAAATVDFQADTMQL